MSEPKRFKPDLSSLEQLPNELFIEIFSYLNGVDTVYAFSLLNTRFQSLLIQHINIFDFKSISKAKFHYVIQQHDIHQWRSLRLSDDNHTPGQIRLFCQLYPLQQSISQLQSLSAVHMTPEYAREFMLQIVSLNNLVSLELATICGENIQPFELPSLKRLVVTACEQTTWMMKFHSLESLEYNIKYGCHLFLSLRLPTTLKQLKLFYSRETDTNTVQDTLRDLPQLTRLALHDRMSRGLLPDGKIWEQFIQSLLPSLKTFQFCFTFSRVDASFKDFNKAVTSFSTPFYLVKKRWFIQCHSTSNPFRSTGVFYSLPFAFAEIPIDITSFNRTITTMVKNDIDKTKYESYKKVKILLINGSCITPYRALYTSNIVKLIVGANFSTLLIPILTNLRHLDIRRSSSISSNDFGQLVANTPKLRSLTIPSDELEILTDRFTNTAVCNYLSEHIQSLTLDLANARLLSSLVRIFGKKCKHLSLAVAVHPDTVLPILQRMKQLHSLHIQCQPWCNISRTFAKSWLESQSTGPIGLDFVHINKENDYYIWFGNRF